MDQRQHTDRDHLHDARRDDAHGDGGHLVLHGDEVAVHTERVETGRVTLRKQVVTEEVTVPVTLRHERLEVIEETFDGQDGVEATDVRDGGRADDDGGTDTARTDPTRRDATRTDVRQLDDGDVEITLYAERPVVSVEVVAVERVRVRRGVVTETQTLQVDVEREEAYLEEEPATDRDRLDR